MRRSLSGRFGCRNSVGHRGRNRRRQDLLLDIGMDRRTVSGRDCVARYPCSRSVRRLGSTTSSGTCGAPSDFGMGRAQRASLRTKSPPYRRPAPRSIPAHPPPTPARPRPVPLRRCFFRVDAPIHDRSAFRSEPDSDDDLFRAWSLPAVLGDGRANRARSFIQCLERRSDPLINMFQEECRRSQVTPCPIQVQSGCLRSEGYEMTDAHCIALRQLLISYSDVVASLDLTRNSIAYKGAILLANAASTLSNVVLAQNRLGRYGAFVWAQFVSRPDCCLRSLNLSGNRIGAFGADLLRRGLGPNRSLTSLNISSNQIGNEGARAISQLVATTTTLRVLDVGSNHISTEGTAFLAAALERNTSLTALLAPWSSFSGPAGVLMALALTSHAGVRLADLRCCDIGPEAGMVLAHALRVNHRLQQLLLSGNPIFWAGKAIIWAAITSTGSQAGQYARLSMADCDLQLPDSGIRFDPFDPSGRYDLDLSCPIQYAIAAEVFALAEQPGVCMLSDFTVNGDIPFETKTLNREQPWLLLPERVLARFRFDWYPAPAHHFASRRILGIDQFNVVLNLVNDPAHSSDEQRLDLLFEACSMFFFDRGQVVELVRLFQPGSEARVSAASLFAVRYLPAADDTRMIHEILCHPKDPLLSKPESQLVLKRTHGFSALNPSGHYILDLSQRVDLVMGRTLAQISGWQSFRRDPGAVADWSQCGFRHLWRNVIVDGVASATLLDCLHRRPPQGIVEFDFALRVTPDASATPMLAIPFLELVHYVSSVFDSKRTPFQLECHDAQPDQNRASCTAALDSIRQACIHNYFLQEQARVLLGCFPDDECRVDALIILYGRIIDEIGVRKLALEMFSPAGQHTAMRRIGYLALWSPFTPFLSYALDLSHNDARTLLKLIMCLCVVEERFEITNMRYNEFSINVPAIWMSQVSVHGFLQFNLNLPVKPNLAYRERVASVALSWAADVVRDAGDEIRMQFPVAEMIKLRRKRILSTLSTASNSSATGHRRFASLPPAFHKRFDHEPDR